MKAILVKYIPTSYTKPSRLKALDKCGNSITFSCGFFDGNHDQQAEQVAQKLVDKMNWKGKLVGPGGLGEELVFILT